MPRIRPRPTGWALTREQKAELRDLLADVDPNAGEGDPRFLALLACWRGCEPPWDSYPTAPAYLCSDGGWLTAGLLAVVEAIRVHIEA